MKGQLSIKWLGSSVSGLVVIAGIIAMVMGNTGTGIFLIMSGLVGAILITAIIRG